MSDSRWITVVYQLIFRPGEAFRLALSRYTWGAGVVAFLATAVGLDVAMNEILRLGGLPAVRPAFVLLFPVRLALAVAVWIVAVSLSYAMARSVRGYGRPGALFLVYGLASLPLTLAVPVAVVASALGAAGAALFFLTLAILVLWAVVLAVIGVKESFCVRTESAALSVLLPMLVMPLPALGAFFVYSVLWQGITLVGQML